MNLPLLIAGARMVDPAQGINSKRDILIDGEKVLWVGEGSPPVEPGQVLPAPGLVVCPGFIDLHCHLREPGDEEKETIASATRAAARGGFTTLCAMPNTRPPADSAAVVDFVHRKALAEGVVRVLVVGCLSRGRRGEELAEMAELAGAGVVGFSDDGSPVASPRLMRHAMEYSLLFGLPIMEHAEEPGLAGQGVMNEGPVSLRLGLAGIPAAAEEVAVARDITLSRLTGAHLHLCHLSTAGAVELVRRAKQHGLLVTAEVAPHHLTLTEERVMGDGLPLSAYDTNAKVNPPLRSHSDRQALIQGVREGVIDAIATDHAPHTIEEKLVEFDAAPFGLSGLETALGSLLSLVHQEELDLATLISKLTTEPARIIGQELGTLKPGSPADITLVDLEREWLVAPEALASKGKNTPLAGERLRGKVMATLVAGRIAYQDEAVRVENWEPQRVRR